jgi:hypothetical protein
MKVVAKSLCNSTWKYIPFLFNQHNIEEAKELSNSLGIKNFYTEYSDRFDDQTKFLIPSNSLIGSRYNAQVNWKSNNADTEVNPKCYHGQEHFITADGYYTPCCYLADHRFYYKTVFGKNKNQYDIGQHTLAEILQQKQMVEFYQTVNQQPGCQYNCPKTPG